MLVFKKNEKISYSKKYTKLSSCGEKSVRKWRQGMICGNGKQGVVISGAPYDETFIFQDIDFILPNKNYRGNYDITADLEPTRQAIINYDNTVIGKGVSVTLTNLISSKIYYYSLMTNHHINATSAYCTDFEIGYEGIVNETLVYSDRGEINVLPALPDGWNMGSIKGIVTRTQAKINVIWNKI